MSPTNEKCLFLLETLEGLYKQCGDSEYECVPLCPSTNIHSYPISDS